MLHLFTILKKNKKMMLLTVIKGKMSPGISIPLSATVNNLYTLFTSLNTVAGIGSIGSVFHHE
jgi:hypothetical protein